jgi:hypothetical protein
MTTIEPSAERLIAASLPRSTVAIGNERPATIKASDAAVAGVSPTTKSPPRLDIWR